MAWPTQQKEYITYIMIIIIIWLISKRGNENIHSSSEMEELPFNISLGLGKLKNK